MTADLKKYARECQAQQGWTDATLLELTLDYINDHAGHQSFRLFLDEIIAEENGEELL